MFDTLKPLRNHELLPLPPSLESHLSSQSRSSRAKDPLRL